MTYYSFSETVEDYRRCLMDILDWLIKHEQTIKRTKLNNIAGLKRILNGFVMNTEDLVKNGGSASIHIHLSEEELARILPTEEQLERRRKKDV